MRGGGSLAASDVLDFGCGHGRVVRHFARTTRSVAACDINHEGVRFCARAFGAVPILGSTDLGKVDFGDYDGIWLGSVVTHHPAEVCTPMLTTLAAHLRPGGVLVFTSQDDTAIDNFLHDGTTGWIADHAARLRDDLAGNGAAYITYPQNPNGSYGLGFQRDEWWAARLEAVGLERIWNQRPWTFQKTQAWRRPA